jgi:hypothetical protein
MTSTNTLTVTFEPGTDGAAVRWEADVLGSRTSHFTAPYRSADLALVIRALDVLQDPYYPTAWTESQQEHFSFNPADQARLATLGLWCSDDHVAPDAPRRVGQALYAALTAGPVAAQALGTARDHATVLGHELALVLRFPPGAVELAALPWELLWDEGPAPLLLSRQPGLSYTRHLNLAQALPPPRRALGPLRILAVAPHAGIPPELRQIERAARTAAWKPLLTQGQATIEEVSPATRPALLDALRRASPPDVVHFYGHGRYEDGQGALLLDDLDGGEVWIPADAVAALFGGVGLVALHACQGAAVSGTDGSGALAGGVVPALIGAGVPLALGMQLSVRTDAAARFSADVYRALAAGQSVQSAVDQARRSLYVAENDRVSWFVPALYIRSRDTGPAYLRHRPGAQAPAGTRQTVIAQGHGLIQALRMRAGAGAEQLAEVERGGRIVGADLSATGASRQSLHSAEDGVLSDIELRARG